MLSLLSIFDTTLPVANPVLRFLIVLIIILAAPLLLNKIKIPYLIGLIIAGAVIGPHGFNVLERDSNIVVTGTTGLLYIMFLAGLEIDLVEFKKNKWKSVGFGLYTFAIPLITGVAIGYYVLNFSWLTSFLFASLFSTHTLISYPLLGKLGLTKNRAVNITVGGTMITDILALLILAIVVGITQGEVNAAFWIRLAVSFGVFSVLVLFGFPFIGRWFFKNEKDKISQYIFVLVIIYLAALLAELAGVEGIIGAFFAGLALNRLIPHTSALMNRIEFVGNAYFIPFFLISVGMLIDFKVFFKDFETIKVVFFMTVAAIISKYLAAYFTQKTFGYTKAEKGLIFGLSASHAAATLAVVLVGYNIIIGESETGEPLRLFNESVLNGSIILILVSCTLSSFVTQKNGEKILEAEAENTMDEDSKDENIEERILIPVNYLETTEDLVNLSIVIKSKKNKEGLFALNIIDNADPASEKHAKKIMELASSAAVSVDAQLQTLIRYDDNIVNGISGIVKENDITDIVLGLTDDKGISSSFMGNLTEGILTRTNTTTLIYKPSQPLSTIKKHLIIVPEHAEKEIGFPFWLIKVWNIARNTGATLVFYASAETLSYIKSINNQHPVTAEFINFADWEDFLIVLKELSTDDNLVVVFSRQGGISFNENMAKIPDQLNKYFKNTSFIMIYPKQLIHEETDFDFRNPSMMSSIQMLDEIAHSIAKLFKMK